MPFSIIRNDITRVKADAIVNTANPEPCYASGTDAAIYEAAGADELLDARKKIGKITPGEAAVTSAFRLPAKYIIHTVGPAWIDGDHGEYDILRSCYRKSLLLADQLGCESIAFPLIATGIYGFPKDKALDIALTVIREHLEESDLQVTLVVFGQESFQIASGLVEQVEEYIDENYAAEKSEEEYGPSGGMSDSRRRRRLSQRELYPANARRDTILPDSEAPLLEMAVKEEKPHFASASAPPL
ncbi:MAG: macro domain-containing protein, partial [Lachnospiraceae bacterium]|nr:macro domain-containing protein [Lachnospiraceae bacterium]